MKHLVELINEDKIRYNLSDNYVQKTKKILEDFVGLLPDMPNVNHNGPIYPDGEFCFNESDILRTSLTESAEYIGYPQFIHLKLNSEKEKGFNINIAREAFKNIFNAKINEGIFGDNVTSNLPEWEWVQKLYNEISKYFKTKSLDNIKYEYYARYAKFPPGIYKTLKNFPTVEKDGLFVTLYDIDISNFVAGRSYNQISILVFVYEKKDPKKVKEINMANSMRKPLDIVGRELKEGDLIAFAGIGDYGGYKGMLTGTVTKASKDQVSLDSGKSVYANRCCLIARKGGKMIE